MRCLDRLQDLLEDAESPFRGQRRLVADDVAQSVTAGDVFHGEEQDARVVALVVDGDDVRMGQPGGGARLADEPLAEDVVVGESLRHDLECDEAVEPQVGGLVDRRHPAARNALADEVAPFSTH